MSKSTFTWPPIDGSVLLHQLPEYNGQANPDFPIYAWTDPQTEQSTAITRAEFAFAVRQAAAYFGQAQRTGGADVVAIVAHADTILMNAVIMGLMQAGSVPFPMAPVIPVTHYAHLLKLAGCNRVVISEHLFKSRVDEIKAALGSEYILDVVAMPTMSMLYSKDGQHAASSPTASKASSHGHTPALDDYAYFMHSSGSTGLPKVVKHTHRNMLHWMQLPVVNLKEGNLHEIAPVQGMMILPYYHMLFALVQLIWPLLSSMTAVIYPPTGLEDPTAPPVVPTTQNILQHAKLNKVQALTARSVTIEEWSRDPDAIAYLKTLVALSYGGSSVAEDIGDELVRKGVPLRCAYGATEFGTVSVIPFSAKYPHINAPERWQWIVIPKQISQRWVDQGEGLFELHVLAHKDHAPSVYNLPDGESGFATNDLFRRDPDHADMWKFVGRKDNLISLGNANKVMPTEFEEFLICNPSIKGAVVFGIGHNHTGLLVEPAAAIDASDKGAVQQYIESIWPTIEKGNAKLPGWGAVTKNMVLLTDPKRPFPRGGKGLPITKLVLAVYAADIKQMYY